MSYLVALALAIAALFGISQPASADLPASQPASLSASQISTPPNGGVDVGVDRCEEDEPCWDDCSTMGNSQCGAVAHEVDAYASFDALEYAPNVNDSMMLTYVSSFTTEAPTLHTGQFIVSSVHTEGLTHVMQWDVLHTC